MTISTAKKTVSISQSNELTEAAYYLPLQAKRVLWLCLIQCYPQKDDPDSVSPVFTVLVADYQKYFKVSVDTASADVKKGVTALAESSVVFYPKDCEFDEIKRPWLAEAGLKKGRGKWQIEFNYKVMPYLMGLSSQFTTYSLYDCGKINSVRVIRLNRPGFPGECFICELRLPDHRFRWKHNKLFLLLPVGYGPAFPAIVDCYTTPPT